MDYCTICHRYGGHGEVIGSFGSYRASAHSLPFVQVVGSPHRYSWPWVTEILENDVVIPQDLRGKRNISPSDFKRIGLSSSCGSGRLYPGSVFSSPPFTCPAEFSTGLRITCPDAGSIVVNENLSIRIRNEFGTSICMTEAKKRGFYEFVPPFPHYILADNKFCASFDGLILVNTGNKLIGTSVLREILANGKKNKSPFIATFGLMKAFISSEMLRFLRSHLSGFDDIFETKDAERFIIS